MEAVLKSLREGQDDGSKTRSLDALELFISIEPSPKTLSVHARFLERIVSRQRQRIATSVPISKSPSLCLQGFQLALKNEDLPSLLLASLLVLNLNRDKVQFKQPFTWETMHLQLAKKLLDKMPQSDDSNALCKSLAWHHVHECLSSLNYLPNNSQESIDWSVVTTRLKETNPLTSFLEKVVLVCLQVQLEMQKYTELLTSSLSASAMSKASWDSSYRLVWKHAASSVTSPSISYHLRKEGLLCMVNAKANWYVCVQQLYKTVSTYEKYSKAKQDGLYCDFSHQIYKLYALSPSITSGSLYFFGLSTGLNAVSCPYPVLLDVCSMQVSQAWMQGISFSSIPPPLLPFALRNFRKTIDFCPVLPSLYNQLYLWSCQIQQSSSQQLLYLRLLIRSCQETPAEALQHLPRTFQYANEETFADMAERDWYVLAMKWFKAENFDAVISWCQRLAPYFPKCYLILGLSFQKQLKWADAVGAWERGVEAAEVQLEKYLQLLYKVDSKIGCHSIERMSKFHPAIIPLIATQVEKVWLVQYRKHRTDANRDMLRYGLMLWEIVEPTSLRWRRVMIVCEYFSEMNAVNSIQAYEALIKQCSSVADKWIMLMEQHLIARYASLPLQYTPPAWSYPPRCNRFEMELPEDMKLAQERYNNGDYVDAEVKWKQICKEMYQRAYAMGMHECIMSSDIPSKMYLELVHVDEFELFAKIIFSLRQLANVYMATSRNKAHIYVQYLQHMTQKLDLLPMSRQVAALSIQFALHQGQLTQADNELGQLRANPVNTTYHLKQSCIEDILQGDIHTLAKTISLATQAYKRAKVKSVPMYPKFQDILALVYRKLALSMPDPVTAAQKAWKLSPTLVESRMAMQILSQALRQKDTREAISQSMYSLQDAYSLYRETKRSIWTHSLCQDYILNCLASLKHIPDKEMHIQLQWRMSWLFSGLPFGGQDIVADTKLYQERWVSSTIPTDWNIVVLTKYGPGQLLLHRIQNNGASPITVLLPEFAMDKFMKAQDLLIERSKESLSGHTAEEAATWSATQKKQWWKQRQHLNGQLKLLVEKAKTHLSFYQCLLFPRPNPLPTAIHKTAASMFSQHDITPMQQELVCSILYAFANDWLSEELTREGLQSCGIAYSSSNLPPRLFGNPNPPPGTTLLSTTLHGFPWEGLFPENFPVSRLSSMAPLFEAPPRPISRQSVHYVVNPGGDLMHTERFLGDFLTRATSEWHWTTSLPTAADACFSKQVFLYCGHGSGEKYIAREVVAQLSNCPVALLMGCSSARLTNFGLYDPEGMLASYITAKSPAVVGMLWDVTDRDLDRLSLRLLSEWFESPRSLSECLTNARRECKLPYLNGLAAVCYGLPLTVEPN
ncbi:hypothetical protein Ae201684P_007815 [Aphanomyces euteiches]|nr:hypothetical protein Ae201684P_007815 [Aphanomyces euteiches]